MTWRLVKKIILNDGFDGESHSWKGFIPCSMRAYCLDCLIGYDLALLQLYPSLKEDQHFAKLKPACLPYKNKKPSGGYINQKL